MGGHHGGSHCCPKKTLLLFEVCKTAAGCSTAPLAKYSADRWNQNWVVSKEHTTLCVEKKKASHTFSCNCIFLNGSLDIMSCGCIHSCVQCIHIWHTFEQLDLLENSQQSSRWKSLNGATGFKECFIHVWTEIHEVSEKCFACKNDSVGMEIVTGNHKCRRHRWLNYSKKPDDL